MPENTMQVDRELTTATAADRTPCAVCGKADPAVPGELPALLADVRDLLARFRDAVGGAAQPLYSINDVARYTGRTTEAVRRWVSDGHLKACRVAGTGGRGKLMIHRDELLRLLTPSHEHVSGEGVRNDVY
jgi:excisionase family DNA binding protein